MGSYLHTDYIHRSTPFLMSVHRFKPQYDESESEDDYLGSVLERKEESDDDFSSLSFGALNSAQKKLSEQSEKSSSSSDRKQKKLSRNNAKADFNSNEDDFFEENSQKKSKDKNAKRNKHAPSEASSKRKVPRVREIPGLKSAKDSSLYTDIRFDAAYGKADLNRVRKDYAFLDELRQKEIREMKATLKNDKLRRKMSHQEIEEMEHQVKSLQSRLDTLKNRDLSNKIVTAHKKDQMAKMRTGEQVNPYYLKKSEQRKMIQKAKFDSMKSSQREKVMERKRKRKLGQEFRQLEFRGQQ